MPKAENDKDSGADAVYDMILSRLPQITFSCACGLGTGAAARYYGNQVLIAGGTLYVALQLLSYFGYVEVRWNKMDRDFKKLVGNDPQEVKSKVRRAAEFLTANLPNSASFLAGLLIALR